MADERWKRKAQALSRLAEDQCGKPEGDLAREMLLKIIKKHPEAVDFEPVKELIERDLTMRDIGMMRRKGISTDGRWEGETLRDAIKIMQADYRERIKAHQQGAHEVKVIRE